MLPTQHARWLRSTTWCSGRCLKATSAQRRSPLLFSPSPQVHLCNCRGSPRNCGVTARIRNSPNSPSHANRDRAQIGRNLVVRAVEQAVFGINFEIGTNAVRDASAEIFAKLVLTGGKEAHVRGQAA